MRKVFWDDPYQCQLTTKVVSVEGNRILLEETIIFSFSGGQESDKASINNIWVIDSEIVDDLIYYILSDNHNIQVGDDVRVEIDWARRYRLMRLHFAAELILELVTRKMHLPKIGAHISETKARIDFEYDKNISVIFTEILNEYNEIILRDLPIKKDFSDIKHQKRFWEIEGFSKVPCGGTHVKSTTEVGNITLRRKNIGKNKERIEIELKD